MHIRFIENTSSCMRHSDIFKELYMSHNVTILAIWNSVDPQRAMEWGAVKAGALRFAPGISLVRWAETGAGRGGKRLEKVWRLAAVFRTSFDPDYARSAQK